MPIRHCRCFATFAVSIDSSSILLILNPHELLSRSAYADATSWDAREIAFNRRIMRQRIYSLRLLLNERQAKIERPISTILCRLVPILLNQARFGRKNISEKLSLRNSPSSLYPKASLSPSLDCAISKTPTAFENGTYHIYQILRIDATLVFQYRTKNDHPPKQSSAQFNRQPRRIR